jgi:hypothetical protein
MKNEIEKKLEGMKLTEVIELYIKSINDIKLVTNILKNGPDEDDIFKATKILNDRIRKHNNLSWKTV